MDVLRSVETPAPGPVGAGGGLTPGASPGKVSLTKELKRVLLGFAESIKVSDDNRFAETEADFSQCFFDNLTKSVDDVLVKLGIDFYDDIEYSRYCKKKDYALCAIAGGGFCGVYDYCLRVLRDGRHIHVVYQEYWDRWTPPILVVRDVVVREV
jgi:hypothetical protein